MEPTPPDSPVRLARPEDVPRLAGVLARAFDADPLMRWLAKDDRDRTLRLVAGFTGSLRYHSRGLEGTYTTEALEGVALWRLPGRLGDPILDQVRLLPSIARLVGIERLADVSRPLREVELRHRRHMPRPHFYLLALGVDPPAQGRGVGSRLLRPVLQRCDRDGVPAYLETVGEPNRRLYARHGFEVVETLPIRAAAIDLLLMRRAPRRPEAPLAS